MHATPPDRAPRFRVSAHWSTAPSLALLYAGLALAARRLLRLPAAPAALAAAALTAGHIFSDVWHQLGHAAAAALTGHPMRGLRFWFVLVASVYPRDEPPLPARVHITRALGGPLASGLLALLLARAARPLRPSLARRLLWWLSLENLVVFTLQVFVPLGFNDGATIRTWLRRRDR